MPKSSGQNLKITRLAPSRPSPSRPIKRFTQPPPAAPPPHRSAEELLEEMKRILKNPPGIDPRQQVY